MALLTYGKIILNSQTCTTTFDGQEVSLNPKEYALLELFLRYPTHVLSYEAIISDVWQGENIPTYSSVRTQIKRLRKAFQAVDYPHEVVENIHGLGYRLKPLPTAETTIIRPPDTVLKGFFKAKSIEYLVLDEHQVLLYFSPGALHYTDYPAELAVGAAAQASFPELVGLEPTFAEILAAQRPAFELHGIGRSHNLQRPEYINLYAIADQNTRQPRHLFIFCEDASEQMTYRQRLVQHANETVLLLERLRP